MAPLISLRMSQDLFQRRHRRRGLAPYIPRYRGRRVRRDHRPVRFRQSTLLNILGLPRPADLGDYFIEGDSVSARRDALAALRRRTFGLYLQSYNLIPTAKRRENVEVPAVYAGSARDRHDRAEASLQSLKLGDARYRPNQLSGGQQQRVSIARALMNGGRVILARATARSTARARRGDAPPSRYERKGHTVIVITIRARSAAQARPADRDQRWADRCRPLQKGRSNPDAAVGLAQSTREGFAAIADVSEAVKMALRALRANLFRTILTCSASSSASVRLSPCSPSAPARRIRYSDRIYVDGVGSSRRPPQHGEFPRQRGGTNVTLVPADADAITELATVAFARPRNDEHRDASARQHRLSADRKRNGAAVYGSEVPGRSAAANSSNRNDMETYAPVAVLARPSSRRSSRRAPTRSVNTVLVNKIPFQ